MQRVTKKNLKIALPMLAAAAATVCLGVPKAHADFIVDFRTPTNGVSTTITPFASNKTVTFATGPLAGTTELVNDYVLEATNNGQNGSGSTLLGYEIDMQTPGTGTTGAIYIDTNVDINGDGYNDADINGAADTLDNLPSGNGPSATPQFGTAVGTITGIAGAAGNTSSASKFVTTATDTFSVGPFLGANASQTPPAGSTNPPSATVLSSSDPNTGAQIAPFVDPSFINETVHNMETGELFTGAGAPTASGAPVQFANILVPVGTPLEVFGTLYNENSASTGSQTNFAFGVPVTSSTVAAGPSLSLGSAIGSVVATLSVTGAGSGNYNPVVATVANATSGSVVIDPFSPSTDIEIFALDIPATSADLILIAQQLQQSLDQQFPGATVTLSDPSPGGAFKADPFFDVFVDIQTPGSFGNDNFNFNLTGFTGLTGSQAPVLAAIGVVPEPTGLGVLALGALGLMGRRRRLAKA